MSEETIDDRRESVLFAYQEAVPAPTVAALTEWIARYPDFAGDLIEFTRDWALFNERDVAIAARADLTTVRDLRDQALQARALSISWQRPLTHHQHRVWALVAAGRSRAEIAQEMGSSAGAVKQDIARIKEKIGVATTEQLKVAYRWTTDR